MIVIGIKLWVAGITSVTRNQYEIFQSLAVDDSVEIIASLDKKMIESEFPSFDYLKSAYSRDSLMAKVECRLRRQYKKHQNSKYQLTLSEVATCIEKVKELIHKGTNPAKIAILATSERDYGQSG